MIDGPIQFTNSREMIKRLDIAARKGVVSIKATYFGLVLFMSRVDTLLNSFELSLPQTQLNSFELGLNSTRSS